MSALEAVIAASGEADLLQSLSFDLPPATTAIVDRKQGCRAYPTSASTLVPNGTKSCRIRLGGNDFVDPSTIRLQYTLTNTDATKILCPAVGPWGPFGLVRLLSNGCETDNFPAYNRFHELHGWRLLTTEQQAAEAVYGWHSAWNGTTHPTPGQLPPGASITCSFKPLLSLFTAGKFLPLRYASCDTEWTLAAATDWLNANNYATTPATASMSYSISNIQLYYDSVTLDEALSEKLYAALLSNKVLNIPTSQYYQVVQSLPAGSSSYSFSVVRAFSRLTHIWITFRTANGLVSQEFAMPTLQNTEMTSSWTKNPNFIADMPAPSIRLSIGPKNIPDYQPVTTTQEHFWMLQKSLPATPYLDRKDFASNTFVSVFNLERCSGDPQTALSTRSGDQIRVDIKGLTPDVCTECWVTIWAMAVCSIRESGISVLD
jgi:hypothetical protein